MHSKPRSGDGSSGDGSAPPAEQTPYRNLFPEAAPAVCEALLLARAEAASPHVVSWLRACEAWDAAIADGSYRHWKKLRELCSEHGIERTRVISEDKDGSATLEHVRRQLEQKAQELRRPRSTLLDFFQVRQTTQTPAGDVAQAELAVATDVRTAFLRLRSKQQENKDDGSFQRTLSCLDTLRRPISCRELRKLLAHGRGHLQPVSYTHLTLPTKA